MTNRHNVYKLRLVPRDFPAMPEAHAAEREVAWGICEELACHVAREVAKEKQERSTLLAVEEILEIHYESAKRAGWGTPEELDWSFKRAGQLLSCSIPDSLRS